MNNGYVEGRRLRGIFLYKHLECTYVDTGQI